MKSTLIGLVSLFLLCALNSTKLYAQDGTLSSDELFLRARTEAFDHKDYPAAVQLAKKALQKSPDYTDIQVFLGRLYTWMDHPDSARVVFKTLEQKKSDNEDFHLAYASMEYWEDQNEESLRILNQGLASHPKSKDLGLLKAKVLNASNKYAEANQQLNVLLEDDPKNTEARELANSIREQVAGNEIGLTYNWMHFDKQFADDWHIMSVSYKRRTPIGSVIFKTNFANKFGSNGTQFELEAYPRLSKTFYMYLGTGYSNSSGLFPKFRTGASLYANLPASFEAEIGYRQLKFSENVWMYTASVGKYYKNLWFNLRTYLTPGEDNISHSYAGTVRYYTKGADDYFGLIVGTGISPEENRENLLIGNTYKLKTFKSGLEYNLSVKEKNLFSISGTYYNVEYQPEVKDNQIDITVGYRRRF
ncbi:YaiO family outer membrane beta-barrel protein [Sphingobacterium sp. DK4209]|uniref:YaiO family outer membrane beta-barrel protein n=1 Tax=Sphingobacterium zhuxiongii TaxID=2662364 RepID=A0A5Q0QGE1_9SPHI|nr:MULTISPECIES: YaiO family outer membrane beta-barrel protein [unclassified Sphingobacterium]MVZ64639.1 YaiO family outer membrane beta-barrel protein [Sphingobacterium sp. DK4209]QGA26978.1 YaiO family outer membrane beta-barrel protein [Sphingobacterium sp. dk4302]